MSPDSFLWYEQIMLRFGRWLDRARRVRRRGVTSTEYAVMLALIIVVALTAIQTLGTSVSGIFTSVDQGISG